MGKVEGLTRLYRKKKTNKRKIINPTMPRMMNHDVRAVRRGEIA